MYDMFFILKLFFIDIKYDFVMSQCTSVELVGFGCRLLDQQPRRRVNSSHVPKYTYLILRIGGCLWFF